MSSMLSAKVDPKELPNSALVVEHLCLFSHDLTKKLKRWRDGRLKHHTFNNRIMVYDDRGNVIGDKYWLSGRDLANGEEMILDRGNAVVQVLESVGEYDQDLSEVVGKRVKDREKRAQVNSSANRQTPLARPTPQTDGEQTTQRLKHRSLSEILGLPTSHYRRAVAQSSPPNQQQRKQASGENDDSPSKRRKHDYASSKTSRYAESLFGTPLNLSQRVKTTTNQDVVGHRNVGRDHGLVSLKPADGAAKTTPRTAGLNSGGVNSGGVNSGSRHSRPGSNVNLAKGADRVLKRPNPTDTLELVRIEKNPPVDPVSTTCTPTGGRAGARAEEPIVVEDREIKDTDHMPFGEKASRPKGSKTRHSRPTLDPGTADVREATSADASFVGAGEGAFGFVDDWDSGYDDYLHLGYRVVMEQGPWTVEAGDLMGMARPKD